MATSIEQSLVSRMKMNLKLVKLDHPAPGNLSKEQAQVWDSIPALTVSRLKYWGDEFFYLITSTGEFIALPLSCLKWENFSAIER
jgi:hypothetical protein